MNPMAEERIKESSRYIKSQILKSSFCGELVDEGNSDMLLVLAYHLGRQDEKICGLPHYVLDENWTQNV